MPIDKGVFYTQPTMPAQPKKVIGPDPHVAPRRWQLIFFYNYIDILLISINLHLQSKIWL
jgi:hypothetical protein